MKAVFFYVLGFGVAIALAAQAEGQKCGPTGSVVQTLQDRYGEIRQARGLTTGGEVLELFASEDTGTWTILVTSPLGVACMVASGRAYDGVLEVRPKKAPL